MKSKSGSSYARITAIFSTDSLEEQDMDFEGQEEDAAPDAPIAVSIIVEKDGQEGALEVTSTVQGESFFIDNVSYIASAKLAQDQTAEGDWSRRGKFSGPVFADLDESVIESFHQYIEERGFDKELAEFITNYVVAKEQKEYVAWLQKVSDFISK
ncbi:Mitochondrial acidic protein mam33 [Kappamyces sp. JEL0680]|nr:Mitochondrial acidic protein mam33 [Kappamyces sp. JEL0680]